MYTDGWKTESGVGSGFVIEDASLFRTLPKGASVYTAELYAVCLLYTSNVVRSEGFFLKSRTQVNRHKRKNFFIFAASMYRCIHF